jgi:hypothetical protein
MPNNLGKTINVPLLERTNFIKKTKIPLKTILLQIIICNLVKNIESKTYEKLPRMR